MDTEESHDGQASKADAKFSPSMSADELIAYAKASGIKLSDEMLSGVAGGSRRMAGVLGDHNSYICPSCNHDNFSEEAVMFYMATARMRCASCNNIWKP